MLFFLCTNLTLEWYVIAMHIRCIGDFQELLDKIREASATLGEQEDEEPPSKSKKNKSKSTTPKATKAKSTKDKSPSKGRKGTPDPTIALFPEEFM